MKEKIRLKLNYRKDGLIQILPILYVENDNERALLFGFGKYNIAFVKGENVSVLEESNITKIKNDSPFQNLNKYQKAAITIAAVAAIGIIGYVVFKSFKQNDRKNN